MHFPNINSTLYILAALIGLSGYVVIRTVEYLISLLWI